MALVPFGEYTPDLPDYLNSGATVALNVVPLTTKSYGPFRQLKTVTSALTASCRGAIGAKDYAHTITVFAGDTTKLYKLNALTWSDVSRTPSYTIGEESYWQFVQYGQRVIAVSLNTNIQSFLLQTDTNFSDLSADAPQAESIAVIRDFVMVGSTYDSVDGYTPNQAWWCAIDNPASWPTPGTSAATAVQSDKQIIPEGGAIQGIIGAVAGSDGAIFLEESIYRVTYVGSPIIFQFDRVEKLRGTRIPGSIINAGISAFYLGVDGFYAFDGLQSTPIGNEKVDKTFFDDFDQTYFYRVFSALDVINKQVMWAYPGAGNTGGFPNKIIIFNWVTNRWSLVEQNLEYFFRDYSVGYTLDQLDPFGTMETLPYSLDSRKWQGGTILLSGFDLDHKFGGFDGDILSATLETGEFDGGNGQRAFITGVRPVVDGGVSSISIGKREQLGATINYSTPTTAGVDGVCPQRTSSRYNRARVTIAPTTTWTHAQGIEPIAQPDGDR